MEKRLSSQMMFKLCSSLNCCENYVAQIFVGCRPIAPKTLLDVNSMFLAMRPGNAAIVQYNHPLGGIGHYVALWQQRNVQDELYYFYYNSIGNIKLFGGRSMEALTVEIKKARNIPCIFNGAYRRVMFIFSLPESLQQRKQVVLDAVQNISDNSNRVLKEYLKLDTFSNFELPHNFLPSLLISKH